MTFARPFRASARLFATASTGLLAVSCVLLVSPATYGDRCKLEGEDTACGRCLRDRCQPAIDACCKEAGCSGTLSTLVDLHADRAVQWSRFSEPLPI